MIFIYRLRAEFLPGDDKMLPQSFRLRKNVEFRKIYKSAKSIANSDLVLYIKKRNIKNNTRIGFSISKKIGKANERNYLKRQLREIMRKKLNQIKPGFDLILIARYKIKSKSYADLEKSVNLLLIKGKLLND